MGPYSPKYCQVLLGKHKISQKSKIYAKTKGLELKKHHPQVPEIYQKIEIRWKKELFGSKVGCNFPPGARSKGQKKLPPSLLHPHLYLVTKLLHAEFQPLNFCIFIEIFFGIFGWPWTSADFKIRQKQKSCSNRQKTKFSIISSGKVSRAERKYPYFIICAILYFLFDLTIISYLFY